ncbi:sorbin and SH3 domain-containing protein 2-like isoform X3 [Stegodyphus dumicola]|uniref:sorbin and SH3 domain-containing protein 2-like isoform X3 n=1 Tax=Stegodyphus dumicola TaxID=202533 RepID=UPI0015A9F33D|nr:sorbin and SH3 domain-containing protein 2-like isoform X3 [Stegodyphus dumicola]
MISVEPLRVRLLRFLVNSKGRQQGLKEGDRILSVNGQPTADMTHAEAQRAIRESSNSLELQIERGVTNTNMNGTKNQDTQEQTSGCHLNCLDEDANRANSWSTDSTSTGSTTIYISPENSESQSGSDRVWSPSRKRANLHLNCNTQNKTEEPQKEQLASSPESTKKNEKEKEETSPVWQPFGAPYDGPQFRPIKLEMSSTKTTAVSQSNQPKTNETTESKTDSGASSLQSQTGTASTADSSDKKTERDSSSQTTTPTTTSTTFTKTGWTSNLPPSQSPTITLLQKAREGQLPKGAIYIDEKSTDSAALPKNAILIDQKVTIDGDKVHTDSYYAVPTVTTESTTHTIKAPPKYEGIGPTEHGIPVSLRTAVKEEFASDWYKTMYKSLHRNRYPDDKYQTVHLGGYMSEPEFDRKDKLKSKYATTDYRRKPEKSVSYTTEPPSSPNISKKTGTESSVVKHERQNVYKVEPRSIAEYEPGHSSLAEKEFEKFWSDFWDSMDDLHEHLGSSPRPQQGLARRWPNVLLSDGYESDSTLIRKTGRVPHVDPEQQKAWYKEIQKGGEIPFIGLRKSAPEKPAASPHQYQETEVNIHYRSPIRHLEKEYIEEEELRKRQEDAMRKLYEEERRKKQQQELAEIEMRRHSDFFTPSQKSPIPLNRYDNPFELDNRLTITRSSRGPPPKTMARALYPFVAQTPRELSLNKGDILYINKQIDKNWFEGEHHGLVGIFPVTYVEIIPSEKANLQPRKATEGEAIVRYNFRAQTPVELSLFKGEKVVLTRKVDQNWYEGRLGTKKGIFPISYVEVLQEPGECSLGSRSISPRPPASPVYSPIVNGSPPKHEGPTFNTGLRPLQNKPPLNLEKLENKSSLTQSLHIDTYNEPIPYRSLYSYKPQNDDELELKEGDTVYVMEKCDDGWYVGTSLRTGLFGTFPGNYVERI